VYVSQSIQINTLSLHTDMQIKSTEIVV